VNTEEQQRIEAIRRVVLQGERVTQVCADLGRTRVWFYKWYKRYQTSGLAGLHDQRGHHAAAHRTAEPLRHEILAIRDRLVAQAEAGPSFGGIGAREVAHQLAALGVRVPHWTTIHGILKAADRIRPASGALGYCPRPGVGGKNSVHQVDIWPRFLKGGERLYVFHAVDVACWYPFGLVKSSETALAFLVATWQELGLPTYVQLDNEMSFTGGRWAHCLGRVVRLCLALGVEVWFNPFYTPERNGYVESYHGLCATFFWQRQEFQARAQVQAQYRPFLEHFRQERTLPAIAPHTPAQMRQQEAAPLRLVPAGFTLHQHPLPLVAGRLHCVRLVNAQGQANILNRVVTVNKTYARQYVWAQMNTLTQQMALYHQAAPDSPPQLLTTEPFAFTPPVLPYDASFQYGQP